MQAVEAIDRPDGDVHAESCHYVYVPTVVDGMVSAFDLFNVQRPLYCLRYLRPLPKTRPDAITEAWNIVGAAMYEAMGRLVTEPADEQR